jgi:prophage DNA circulation protein
VSWRDTLRPATFRGVGFKVGNSEMMGGRRTVSHEYPLRDEPFVEDMGRRARRYPVEGWIVGPDYHTARDALISALEKYGAGTLVHPYLGNKLVLVSGFRVRESAEEGGMCRFAIDFEETGPLTYPVEASDDGTVVGDSADLAATATEAEFTGLYSVDNEPQFGLDSLVTAIQDATDWINDALAPVTSATQDLASLNRLLDNMYLDADGLIREPFVVFSRFKTALGSLFTLPATPLLSLKHLLKTYGFTGASSHETTATRRREAANQRALYRMINRLSIIEAARIAPRVQYESYEQAKLYRDEIADNLDTEADDAGDELYSALAQLRADLVAAVPGVDSDLPRLAAYTPLVSRPSLAIAYELFGDVKSEADIIARNRVRHPGFVLGGRELEILTRE